MQLAGNRSVVLGFFSIPPCSTKPSTSETNGESRFLLWWKLSACGSSWIGQITWNSFCIGRAGVQAVTAAPLQAKRFFLCPNKVLARLRDSVHHLVLAQQSRRAAEANPLFFHYAYLLLYFFFSTSLGRFHNNLMQEVADSWTSSWNNGFISGRLSPFFYKVPDDEKEQNGKRWWEFLPGLLTSFFPFISSVSIYWTATGVKLGVKR